jgi:hypothetical protein
MQMKKYSIIILIISFLISCKTSELYLNVVEPAPVTIPDYVKRVGVINRSMPTDETKSFDILNKALTLEGVDLDKDGAQVSIQALSDELLNNNRFVTVKLLNDIDFRTSSLTTFPTTLSWEIVAQICDETGTDALFSLEKFDTDSRINYSSRTVELKTILGNVPALEHQLDMETIVKTGWRIYDPAAKSILDEYLYQESIMFSGKGINPMAAFAALTGRKDAVNQASNKAGQGYAYRLLPIELRVMREYYVKGTDNFKIAQRKAQVGKWDEAGLLWEKETTNSKMKIAGRACYNMAIINEINGNLEEALKWAQRSYEDYNDKLGIRYVRILENRKYENEVLREQGQK